MVALMVQTHFPAPNRRGAFFSSHSKVLSPVAGTGWHPASVPYALVPPLVGAAAA